MEQNLGTLEVAVIDALFGSKWDASCLPVNNLFAFLNRLSNNRTFR